MSRPHPAQFRLLSFLALEPAGSFVDLVEIDRARQVRPGDDLFVPSLVARGWAEMGRLQRASVRITDVGRVFLVAPDLDDHARHPRQDRPSTRET